MDEDKQRIAIAEACGWTLIQPEALTGELEGLYPNGKTCHRIDLPDYLYDLNAMHEAEKSLDPKVHDQFGDILEYLCHDWTVSISATASQRAEAFLKTIGEWEDGE